MQPAERSTVLVVDDSAIISRPVQSLLERSGYDVIAASDGAEALSCIESGVRPDLILTDIHLPSMDGMSFIRAARGMDACRFVPIVALAPEMRASARDEARRVGATGWLVKPATSGELLGALRALLPRE